jgi:hypothetical protein
MHTEKEANTKWCPMVRVLAVKDDKIVGHSVNAGFKLRSDPNGRARCVGSECMMWRWERTDGDHIIATRGSNHGYCGLAGRQEIVA